MKFIAHYALVAIACLIALGLAACGTTTSSTSATNPTLPIQTASATVNGKTETILTDSRGFALYYYTPDTATTTACTEGCAQAWPPLVASSSEGKISATALPGKCTFQQTANGLQVEYNGHLLYTFLSDTAPNQVNGNNAGNWFVATPALH